MADTNYSLTLTDTGTISDGGGIRYLCAGTINGRPFRRTGTTYAAGRGLWQSVASFATVTGGSAASATAALRAAEKGAVKP